MPDLPDSTVHRRRRYRRTTTSKQASMPAERRSDYVYLFTTVDRMLLTSTVGTEFIRNTAYCNSVKTHPLLAVQLQIFAKSLTNSI